MIIYNVIINEGDGDGNISLKSFNDKDEAINFAKETIIATAESLISAEERALGEISEWFSSNEYEYFAAEGDITVFIEEKMVK